MHNITDHKINGLNEQIHISAMDDPGSGGAHHEYWLNLLSPPGGPGIGTIAAPTIIRFQNGPLLEVGINGFSNEALIAVVIDRMRGFQSGQFACRENALALTKLEEAVMWLHKRTRDRVARGVEGTHLK